MAQESVEVLLCLPLLSANGGNLDDGRDSARPRRWQSERVSTCNPEEVCGWLPSGELHGDLMALLHVFLGSHLDVRLQLCVARNLLPDARLACDENQAVQIGRTAVLRPLSSQQNRHDIITINLGRYQRVQENIHRRESDEDGNYRW
ncbi:type VI secretion system baseplate subunit TssG [Enterobacter cloacae]